MLVEKLDTGYSGLLEKLYAEKVITKQHQRRLEVITVCRCYIDIYDIVRLISTMDPHYCFCVY